MNTISPNIGPDDSSSLLSSIQDKVGQLEDLLASVLLKTQYDYDPDQEGLQPYPGIDNGDLTSIQESLSLARKEQYDLTEQMAPIDVDPLLRLDEIEESRLLTDKKISELQTQLEEVMGVNNNEPSEEEVNNLETLQDELNRMLSYRNELKNSQTFWNDLVDYQKEYEAVMLKNSFFDGTSVDGQSTGGFNTLVQLEALLQHLESGNDGSQFDGTVEGLSNLNDKTEVRQKIAELQTELLGKIESVQNEEWYQDFLNNSQTNLTRVDTETTDLQKKLDELNKAFISMITGSTQEAKIGDQTYTSTQDLKEQIIRTSSYLEELNGQKSFFGDVLKISNADSDSVNSMVDESGQQILARVENYAKADELTSAQYTTMEWQALANAMSLGTSSNVSVSLDSYSVESANKAYEEAKAHETYLREEYGLGSGYAAYANLALSQTINTMVDTRLSDLEEAQVYLREINQQFFNTIDSQSAYTAPYSFYYEDPNLYYVSTELERISEYKKTTEELADFWQDQVGEDRLYRIEDEEEQGSTTENSTIQTIFKNTNKNVSNLKAIFDIITDGPSLEALQAEEEQVKQEIEYEMSRAKSAFNNHAMYTPNKNPALARVSELQSKLGSIMQLQQRSQMMSKIAASVKETLSKESLYKSFQG